MTSRSGSGREPAHARYDSAMESTTIRPATAGDEDAILALIEELFKPPGARPPDYSRERARKGIRWALEQPHSDILLACEGRELVGLASVYADIQSIRYGPRCWLQDLVVAAGARRRGIGRKLLDAATEWAKKHGCTHLELASGTGRKDAHRFYLREGMTQSYNFKRSIE